MSGAEVPESYLAILVSSFEQREHEKGDERDDHEHQLLGLLDALAGICVSQAEGEVYASAIEIGPESCAILIIGNHEEVPRVTQDYLADIIHQLTDVASLTDTGGRTTPSEDDICQAAKDKIETILTSVVSFTFGKFLSRLTKRDGPWQDRMRDIDHHLVDAAEREKFRKLQNALNVLYQIGTFPTRDAGAVVQVLTSVSHRWKLSDSDTETFIRYLDRMPTSDQTDVSFLIERYIRKVLKTYNEASKLIHYALSPGRGHIFRNLPELVFLRSEKRRVELDIKTAMNTFQRMKRDCVDRFLSDGGERIEEQYTCCAHCECAMMVELLKRWGMQQRLAPIIGISKLSCLGCRLYFRAYNMASSQLRGAGLPLEFVVTGAHNTLYLPWVSPDLTSINPNLHADIQQHLLSLAQGVSVVPPDGLSRRNSESSTHSSKKGEIKRVDSTVEKMMDNLIPSEDQNEHTVLAEP